MFIRRKTEGFPPDSSVLWSERICMAQKINESKRRQLEAVATMKYKLGLSNAEIAKRLDVSAMSISRFLDMALDAGIVRISVRTSITEDDELENDLKNRFGLRDAVVASGGFDSNPLSITASSAAEYLDMILTDDDVLGIAAGNTIGMTIPHIRLSSMRDPSDLHVVQIMGGNYNAGKSNPSYMINTFVNRFGAKGFLMQVPQYARTVEQYEAARASLWDTFLAQWKSCTVLLFALGTLSEEIINENDGMVSESDYDELVQKRAVGRLFGYWIDSDGKLLDCSSNRKIFAIPFEIAKDVPLKIAVSSGEDRIPVIQAALKTGLLDVLITDSRTAKKLLLSVDS